MRQNHPKTDIYCFQNLEWHKCEKCKFQTHLKVLLKNHVDLKHHNLKIGNNLPQRVHTCRTCKLQTHSIFVLAGHICRKKKMYKCEQCPYQNCYQSKLRDHAVRMHTPADEIQWLRCEQCPLKTKTKDILRKHVARKHTPLEQAEWYECDQCAYKSKIRHNLDAHKSGMHKNVWFECHLCEYRSRRRTHLREHHTRRHTKDEDVEWFECDKCARKYKNKYHLKRHSQKHGDPSKVERFRCELCPFVTAQSSYMRMHTLRKHTLAEETECYECGKCNYKSKIKRDFMRHVATLHQVTSN